MGGLEKFSIKVKLSIKSNTIRITKNMYLIKKKHILKFPFK